MKINNITKKLSITIFVIIFSSGFFLFLYNFDNKYSHDSIQAANGLLVLSEDDLKENPIRFLIRGWMFYPNELLSPQDLKSEDAQYYMKYTSIGDTTKFTSDSPYGSGTYVMNILLPETEKTYSLNIPEIFSAYRLYIDDKLVTESGSPDKENYDPETSNKIITFEKSGLITITIAVSNYSYFYSGLVFPPSFGTNSEVIFTKALNLGITLIVNTISIAIAIISLYFAINIKQKNTLIFSILCVAMCFYTSYPLINSIFILHIFPWYAIELTSGSIVMLLVFILHNRLCKMKASVSIISSSVICLFSITTFLYGLFSGNLQPGMTDAYSKLVFAYKIYAVIYLISTSCITVKNHDTYLSPLLYSSIFFACSCLWDILLPLYEPIITGWFIEWGSLILVLGIGIVICKNIVKTYSHNLAFAEEHKQVNRQLSMQLEYSRQLKENTEENRRLTHDFRHHIRTLTSMAENSKEENIFNYLNTVNNMFNETITHPNIGFCDNIAVDSLLKYYYNLAKNKDININISLTLPNTLPLSDVDFCTILGNLLENAIEACETLPKEQRSIFLDSKVSPQMIFILIENTYDGLAQSNGKFFITRKVDKHSHGIGLESVRKIIESKDGVIDLYPLEKNFRVGLSIPL